MEASHERPSSVSRPARPPSIDPDRVAQTTSADLTNLRNYHDEAYLYIQQALSCDEYGQSEQSIVLYQKGLSCIDRALEIQTGGVGRNSEAWQKARSKKQKMLRTRAQIQGRVDELLSNPSVRQALADPPPAYDQGNALSTPACEDSDFVILGDEIMNDELDSGASNQEEMMNAVEIFSIPDGAQIYFISPEGYVSTPSYPSSLGIYRLRDLPSSYEGSNVRTPPAFLSVGNWTYPLMPGRSPALQSNAGAYIFPDVNSTVEGAAIGVIIPDNVRASEKARFEGLLKYLTDLREAHPAESTEAAAQPIQLSHPAEETRTSAQISKGIVTAAEWISWGLEKGAQKTGEWLKLGSNKLREQIQPESQARIVDPRTQQGIKYARKATDTAVKVSVFLVDSLGKATMALGRKAAPHLRKTGEKYLPKSMTDTSGGQSKLDAVAEVAVGGLAGFGTVWNGLEKAGMALGRSIGTETVSVVKHKYGSQVGDATENALYAVGNAAITAHTASNLGIKAIVKRTAKDAGKAMLEDYRQTKEIKTPSPQEDLLPPSVQNNPSTPQ